MANIYGHDFLTFSETEVFIFMQITQLYNRVGAIDKFT